MDTTVEGITFDDLGNCSFCRAARKRLGNELYVGPQFERKIENLVSEVKAAGRGKPYDCIIGVSGGVDSSYVAYLVKKQFGLRPLAVHFDNGWNSELAVRNIERLLKALEIDLYTYVVDWEEFKDIQLSFLRASIANCEIPTDHAILALLYQLAAKHHVRYILHGGNLATESIMPSQWMHDAKDLRLMRAVHKRFGRAMLRTIPTMGYGRLAWRILVNRIRYISPLNYMQFNKSDAIDLLEREFGWRRYGGKHFESIYTRWFQGYLLPTKFGIDKRRPHYSSLVVSGQMSRDAALHALLDPPCTTDQAQEDSAYICQKFRLSSREFDEIMSAPIVPAVSYPNTKAVLDRLMPLVARIKQVATGRDR